MTIEDPIESAIAGASQSQVRPVAGFDLATGLKSMMRQDPDVILVGEIRDPATAEATFQAALTGHLVIDCDISRGFCSGGIDEASGNGAGAVSCSQCVEHGCQSAAAAAKLRMSAVEGRNFPHKAGFCRQICVCRGSVIWLQQVWWHRISGKNCPGGMS
jgi:hypothetical protein